jgi:glycosyltransferase involved in cell wall biosynthesis
VRACSDLEDPPALVLAGGGGWDDEVDAAMATVPPRMRVLRPGYLPWPSLPGFFGGALVVALPSRGEGFGLPVLEAMACGAPVLTTRRGPLPEVGGDAVAYTEPDPEGIASALTALSGDPARRAALAEAAYARSLEFTWTSSAEAHLASYERAIRQHEASHGRGPASATH